MSDNIITFPQPDDGRRVIWACGCGCTVHYHHASGDVECSACGSIADALGGEWRTRFPEAADEPEPLDEHNFKVIDLSDAESFLRRQIAIAKGGKKVAMVVVAYAGGGGVSTFTEGATADEAVCWLDEARARIARKREG